LILVTAKILTQNKGVSKMKNENAQKIASLASALWEATCDYRKNSDYSKINPVIGYEQDSEQFEYTSALHKDTWPQFDPDTLQCGELKTYRECLKQAQIFWPEIQQEIEEEINP
jgi:hypothetical protein